MEGHRSKRKRRFILTSLLVLALIGIWAVAEFGIDVDWYRPKLEAKIEEFSGLPSHVAELDFSVLPSPRIVANEFRIGDGDFQLDAKRIVLLPRLLPLLRGNIAVSTVDVIEPTVHIPENFAAARERFNDLVEHIEQRPKPDKKRDTSIDVVRVDTATLVQGDDGEPIVQAAATVREVLSELVRIDLDATIPYLGNEAKLSGELALDLPRGGAKAARGTFQTANLRLDTLTDAQALEGAAVDAAVEIESGDLKRFVFTAQADLMWPAYPNLARDLDLRCSFEQGTLRIDDAQWRSPGLDATFTASWQAQDGARLDVQQAQLGEAGMESLLAANEETPIRVQSNESVALAATDLALVASAGEIYLARGDVTIPGFEIAHEGQVLAKSVHGSLTIENNVINLTPIDIDGFTLHGNVTPNFANGHVAFDLTGDGTLNDAVLLAIADPGIIRDTTGAVAIDTLKGTYRGEGVTAKGTVDFEDLESNVRISVDVLEGVTGLVEKIPIVGLAVGLAKKPFDVRLLVTGSPFDPTVRQDHGQGRELAEEEKESEKPPEAIAQRPRPNTTPDETGKEPQDETPQASG